MFELRLDPNASTSVEILRSKKESEVSMFLPFSERLKVRISHRLGSGVVNVVVMK
jgi:hypothetical protein